MHFFAKAIARGGVVNRYSLLNDGSGLYVLYDDQSLARVSFTPIRHLQAQILSHMIIRPEPGENSKNVCERDSSGGQCYRHTSIEL